MFSHARSHKPRLTFSAALLTAAGACAIADVSDPDPGWNAQVVSRSIPVGGVNRLDLLFVVDGSPSMAQERAHLLEAQLPRALQLLLWNDLPGLEGVMRPHLNLRVAVVSAELGAGTQLHSCDAAAPHVWHFAGFHDSESASAAIRCNLSLDGSEPSTVQPLAALLDVLDQAEFLRPLSALWIVVLTDRDDDSLGEVEELATALRARRPELLELAIVAGVPPELIPTELDHGSEVQRDQIFDAMLADPRMHSTPQRAPSCASASATAYPPRRLATFARAWYGARIRSICDYDLAALLAEMNDRPCSLSAPACVKLPRGDDRSCRVTWELPERSDPEEPLTPVACSERPDILSEPPLDLPKVSEAGRALCELRRTPLERDANGTPVPQGDGFYLEPYGACPIGAIGLNFTEGARPPRGITLRVECAHIEARPREP